MIGTTTRTTERMVEYRQLAQFKKPKGRPRCEVDEFSQGALKEAVWPQPQVFRLLNGKANGAQGIDFSAWKRAVWIPCSADREDVCGFKSPEPEETWKFDAIDLDRRNARKDGIHFLKAYGVSRSAYTRPDSNNGWSSSTPKRKGLSAGQPSPTKRVSKLVKAS
jgi:hypothetical protein